MVAFTHSVTGKVDADVKSLDIIVEGLAVRIALTSEASAQPEASTNSGLSSEVEFFPTNFTRPAVGRDRTLYQIAPTA